MGGQPTIPTSHLKKLCYINANTKSELDYAGQAVWNLDTKTKGLKEGHLIGVTIQLLMTHSVTPTLLSEEENPRIDGLTCS